MRRVLPFKLLFVLLLTACVTVNVYFPAAAAEQAADQIIDKVTRGSNPAPAPTVPPTSRVEQPRGFVAEGQRVLLAAAGNVLELLVPAAHAQANANLDVATPEIRAVTSSMAARFGELQKFFAAGAIGLTNDGMIEVRDANSVALAERATVKRLVADDNKDRATLYAEIAKANGHPEWEGDIRKIFARRWVERGAQPGWYYQDTGGGWKQK